MKMLLLALSLLSFNLYAADISTVSPSSPIQSSKFNELINKINTNDLNLVKQELNSEFFFKVYLLMEAAKADSTLGVLVYSFHAGEKVFKWELSSEGLGYKFSLKEGLTIYKLGESESRGRRNYVFFLPKELEFWEDMHEHYWEIQKERGRIRWGLS